MPSSNLSAGKVLKSARRESRRVSLAISKNVNKNEFDYNLNGDVRDTLISKNADVDDDLMVVGK
jgi:hypothetical protein